MEKKSRIPQELLTHIESFISGVYISNIDFACQIYNVGNEIPLEDIITDAHIELIKKQSLSIISLFYPIQCIADVKIGFENGLATVEISLDYDVIIDTLNRNIEVAEEAAKKLNTRVTKKTNSTHLH